MILTIHVDGESHHPKTRQEEDRLIGRVLADLKYGDNAWFALDFNRTDEESFPDSALVASVNTSTGFGGVIWLASRNYPRKGGVYDSIWVSDNPVPPAVDPNVLSEPHTPIVMDPASTFPVAELRKVIEEFCRDKTGERPGCISWVVGNIGGERTDKEHGAGLDGQAAASAQAVLDALSAYVESGDHSAS
ncbi:Imm1 family immunity protein [Kitasatospora sp. NPDC057904]|uniref:Imm1 family immunity protein n=1 Tax=Kitasatospora sp. NPDC057904 TaxID=3346275 RepID=UPI0036D98AFB